MYDVTYDVINPKVPTFIYGVCIILICYLVIYVYVRSKSAFWSKQPVFHTYDILYWLFPCGIVQHELPEHNKYINFKNIHTFDFKEVQKDQIDSFVNLIQTEYMRFDEIHYNPSHNELIPYMKGHNSPCYLTMYLEDEHLLHTDTNQVTKDIKCMSCITCRPLNIYIDDHKLMAYYIDFLVVSRNNRKNGIAPEMIQTHEYTRRVKNPDIPISIFKRDTDLTNIVPLTTYMNYIFNILRWQKPLPMQNGFQCIQITKDNIYIIYPYLTNTRQFKCIMITELSNLIHLVETNNIHVYATMRMMQRDVYGIYFFRNSSTMYKKYKMMECFASIFPKIGATQEKRFTFTKERRDLHNNRMKNVFIQGFHRAMFACFHQYQYKYLIMENISHNEIIIENIIRKHAPEFTSPSAFYFYNFVHFPFDSSEVCAVY